MKTFPLHGILVSLFSFPAKFTPHFYTCHWLLKLQFFSASKVLLKLFIPLSLRFLVIMGICVFNLLHFLIAFDSSIHSLLRDFFFYWFLWNHISLFILSFSVHLFFLLYPDLQCRCSKKKGHTVSSLLYLSTHFL